MNGQEERHEPDIMVVEDVQETREGIERLLMVDGYRVALAKDEEDEIETLGVRRHGHVNNFYGVDKQKRQEYC